MRSFLKLISVQETLCILHLTCIMKCDFFPYQSYSWGNSMYTSLNLHHEMWHFLKQSPSSGKSLCISHHRKKCVYVWGNTYPMAYAENGIITRASICNKSIQILLKLYKLLHNGERVLCMTVELCVVLVWPFLESTVFSCSWHTLLQLRGG